MSSPKSILTELVTSDPGIPCKNPTRAYWQRVPHRLANVQSPSLPSTAELIIVGSGITGTSVAKRILENHPTAKIVILEARSICSGATGRNGGHLVSNAAENYADWKSVLGKHEACKVAEFGFENVRRVSKVIEDLGVANKCDFRTLKKARTYYDQLAFNKLKQSVAQLEEDCPSARNYYSIVEGEQAVRQYGVFGAVGALLLPAGALWPYRLITLIYEALLEKYQDRLSIESYTPILSISHNAHDTHASHPYICATPRGTILTSKVIHCTNGWAGHLNQPLRGALFPLCGTMTVQELTGVKNFGNEVSWSAIDPTTFDEKDGTLKDGLCYVCQEPSTGFFYFGGDRTSARQALTANDSQVAPGSPEYLQKRLVKMFTGEQESQSRLVSAWSGIMGFTADNLPLVGQLSHAFTNRRGDGEWIAAGFNGYGMSYCWLAGEAVASMILGENVDGWFPASFKPTADRAKSSLRTSDTVEELLRMYPSVPEQPGSETTTVTQKERL